MRVCIPFHTLQRSVKDIYCQFAILADFYLRRTAAEVLCSKGRMAHLYYSKLLLNELDKGQEVLPVQAVLVQLRRCLVGGKQDERAMLTQPREQLRTKDLSPTLS